MEYRCKRIKEYVSARRNYDTGRVNNNCIFYAPSSLMKEDKSPCIKFSPKFKGCQIELVVKREERRKNRTGWLGKILI